jgi:hypothetical protein
MSSGVKIAPKLEFTLLLNVSSLLHAAEINLDLFCFGVAIGWLLIKQGELLFCLMDTHPAGD